MSLSLIFCLFVPRRRIVYGVLVPKIREQQKNQHLRKDRAGGIG